MERTSRVRATVVDDPSALAGTLLIALGRLSAKLRAQPGMRVRHVSCLDRLSAVPSTMSELARAEGIRPASLTRTIAELAERGLVSRWPDELDGRVVRVSITDAGRQALRESVRLDCGDLARDLGRLNADEVDTLGRAVQLMDRIRRSEQPGE